MFEELRCIELSGEKYPIKCDMVVLEKIQNKYINMTEFENGLTGFVPAQEIKMLNDALFWMVKEGEEIKAEEESRPVNEVDRNKILRKIDIPPKDLGTLLHEEFQRCFERKNEKTTQRTE